MHIHTYLHSFQYKFNMAFLHSAWACFPEVEEEGIIAITTIIMVTVTIVMVSFLCCALDCFEDWYHTIKAANITYLDKATEDNSCDLKEDITPSLLSEIEVLPWCINCCYYSIIYFAMACKADCHFKLEVNVECIIGCCFERY